jgi:phosphotransferase system enzyme I (PtsI)
MPKSITEPPTGGRLDASTSTNDAVAGFKAAAQVVHDGLKTRSDKARGHGKAVSDATDPDDLGLHAIESAAKLIHTGTSTDRIIWKARTCAVGILHNLSDHIAERAT